MAKYTLAFAGDGETSEENIKHLLNDFLGLGPEDKEGYPELPEDLDVEILLPLTDTHVTSSVMDVFDYLEYADLSYDLVVEKDAEQKGKDAKALLKYAESTHEVDSANAAIIDLLTDAKEKHGRDARLILFWGEEGSKDAEILLDLASSAEIKAHDMTAGLDDLSFNDPEDEAPVEEPTPEPDPEPEPEERPRRGRRRAAQAEEPKALEDEPEPDPEPEEKPSRRRGRARTEDPAPEPVSSERVAEAEKQDARDEQVDEEANARFKGDEDVIKVPEVEINPDLVNRVQYHPANEVTIPLHEAVRLATLTFMSILDSVLPEGREKSLAFTNAEQAMFWANAAVARSGQGQEASEKPSRGRGRPRRDGADPQPRTAKDKAVTEIWNDETEEWERKGPGRVPKGAKTRLIDPKTGDVVDE